MLPGSWTIEPAAGLTQQGRARDDWGNWFGCDNSTLAWHYPLHDHYARRNPHASVPPARVNLTADSHGLFPTSPGQARFNDAKHAGRVTSACGLTVYRDDWLGEDLRGDLFVCEPVHNLVTRRELERDGATFRAQRPAEEQEREFLSSVDPWFRPVQVTTGPDAIILDTLCRFAH